MAKWVSYRDVAVFNDVDQFEINLAVVSVPL